MPPRYVRPPPAPYEVADAVPTPPKASRAIYPVTPPVHTGEYHPGDAIKLMRAREKFKQEYGDL